MRHESALQRQLEGGKNPSNIWLTGMLQESKICEKNILRGEKRRKEHPQQDRSIATVEYSTARGPEGAALRGGAYRQRDTRVCPTHHLRKARRHQWQKILRSLNLLHIARSTGVDQRGGAWPRKGGLCS